MTKIRSKRQESGRNFGYIAKYQKHIFPLSLMPSIYTLLHFRNSARHKDVGLDQKHTHSECEQDHAIEYIVWCIVTSNTRTLYSSYSSCSGCSGCIRTNIIPLRAYSVHCILVAFRLIRLRLHYIRSGRIQHK